jgi:hypothetical protein
MSLSSAGFGIAVLGLLVAVAPAAATNVAPPWATPANAGRGHVAVRHARAATAPAPCMTNYPTSSFVGIPGSDTAGGEYGFVGGGLYNEACDEYSAVGTGYDNIAGNAGAALYAFIGGGATNLATGLAGFVGSGESNTASGRDAAAVAGNNAVASGNASLVGAGYIGMATGTDAMVGAGYVNTAAGAASFVGGGYLGTVTGNGSFIGAGGSNCNCQSTVNMVSGYDSFIGAGDLNTVSANEAFLGSGQSNTLGSAATYSGILGGEKNTVAGEYASILGGYGNSASGEYGTVAGGYGNTAAKLAFAAGYHADAGHAGSFVWSDYTAGSATLKDTGINQFVVRASGGVYLYSNEGETSGVELTPGSGTFASLSDRNAKTDIVPLDDASILAKVAALPVSTWRYKSEAGVRHVGPMAQDFYAAFGVGVDDRHITSIDEDGVALAAIKALHRENGALRAQVAADHGALAELRAEMRQLEAELSAHAR